jgi:chromosome segregation ATPase
MEKLATKSHREIGDESRPLEELTQEILAFRENIRHGDIQGRKALVNDLHEKLDAWDEHMELLGGRLARAQSEVRQSWRMKIVGLKSQRQSYEDRLRALESATDEAWGTLSQGTVSAWEEMSAALTEARVRFERWNGGAYETTY